MPSLPEDVVLQWKPLGATGTQIQGPLEASHNERFNDALGLGTSLTLTAPAAGNRVPTPSTALGMRAEGTLMQQARKLRTFPQFFEAIEQDTLASWQKTWDVEQVSSGWLNGRGSRPGLFTPRLARPSGHLLLCLLSVCAGRVPLALPF